MFESGTKGMRIPQSLTRNEEGDAQWLRGPERQVAHSGAKINKKESHFFHFNCITRKWSFTQTFSIRKYI